MRKLVSGLAMLGCLWAASGPSLAMNAAEARQHLEQLWPSYQERFITQDGRVIDTANGSISHSEGQGYAMLLAVAMDEPEVFDQIWGWTRQTLGVRQDELFAWVYDPQAGGVRDANNATDGDLLIAWALWRAGEHWDSPAYRHAARTLSAAILTHATVEAPTYGRMILPGVEGFSAAERADGAVFNLSYWVFPALRDLSPLLGPTTADALEGSGLVLLDKARFGEHNLPPDWLALAEGQVSLADGFEPVFGYNAIRAPLYLVWADAGNRGHLAPFMAHWPQAASAFTLPQGASVAQVHLVSGQTQPLGEAGYRAIAELVACAVEGASPSPALRAPLDADYYPATLHLLSLLALNERGLSC